MYIYIYTYTYMSIIHTYRLYVHAYLYIYIYTYDICVPLYVGVSENGAPSPHQIAKNQHHDTARGPLAHSLRVDNTIVEVCGSQPTHIYIYTVHINSLYIYTHYIYIYMLHVAKYQLAVGACSILQQLPSWVRNGSSIAPSWPEDD